MQELINRFDFDFDLQSKRGQDFWSRNSSVFFQTMYHWQI